MSEKIYACLLRLFPSHFRVAYGEEAMRLFRDRVRDEKGFFLRVRLWMDLLADLTISIPHEYRNVRPAIMGAPVQPRLDGAPAFFVLGEESPGPGPLIFGCALSMVALSLFWILLGHAGNFRPLSASGYQRQHATDSRSSVNDRAAQAADDGETATIGSMSGSGSGSASASGPGQLAAMDATPLRPNEAKQGADAGERKRVMEAVIQNLKEHYVDRNVARKTADALLAHEKNGDDAAAADGGAFAELLTRQMREVSHDMHLEVVYSREPLPNLLPEPTAEDAARYRKMMEQENCMFRKVETLPHNIGYLKLDAFPDPAICGRAAKAAMDSVNHADAVIVDLRDNRGGYGSMVSLISAYLFDHPEYMYNPREMPTQQSWTASPVAGSRLANKPVYVLTSRSTISAAELFCYDLKMLKRVTLVGETTRGSAHAGVFHRIDDHFGMGVPEVKAINPYASADWEGIGVEPDVRVKAADALETAVKLAESRLQK